MCFYILPQICLAFNGLSVLPTVTPQIAPFDFGVEPSNKDDVAAVWCKVVKGDLPLDIFWSLNAVPIVSGIMGYTISRMNARTSALTVNSLDSRHRGNYKCLARNAAGQAEHYATLHVNG